MKNTILLLGYIFLSLVQPRVHIKTIQLSTIHRNRWQYISKFSWGIGEGTYKIRARLLKNLSNYAQIVSYLNLQVVLYSDMNWESALNSKQCIQKLNLQNVNKTLEIPVNGKWSDFEQGQIHNEDRPHTWFIVIVDCYSSSSSSVLSRYKPIIEYEIHYQNINGSHMSIEEEGYIIPLCIILIVLIVIVYYNIRQMKESNETNNTRYDRQYIILISSSVTECISILCYIVYLVIYQQNGQGYSVLLFMYIFSQIVAQILVSFQLIMISWGYNIIQQQDTDSTQEYMPLGIALTVIQVLLVCLDFLQDELPYKFHTYEYITGYVILFIRLGLYVYFLFGIQYTYTHISTKHNTQAFLIKFCIVGSLYFFAFPVLFAVSLFSPYYHRHQIITIGTLSMQIFALGLFTCLFSQKNGKYYQLSIRGRTLLPNDKID